MDNAEKHKLLTEIRKLRSALSGLYCCAGKHPEGPGWATVEAKAKNRAQFELAMKTAEECFPEDYNELRELTERN